MILLEWPCLQGLCSGESGGIWERTQIGGCWEVGVLGLVSNLIRIQLELINSDPPPLSCCLHVISLLWSVFLSNPASPDAVSKKGKGWGVEWYPYKRGCLILNRYDAGTTRAFGVLSVFQPAWSNSSATGDVWDAVSVLLWLILERLSPASDPGCVAQEGLVCHYNTDWNKATWSDNINKNGNKRLLLNLLWYE